MSNLYECNILEAVLADEAVTKKTRKKIRRDGTRTHDLEITLQYNFFDNKGKKFGNRAKI